MDPILTNQTFDIAPTGDYATMQAAFDDLGHVPVKNNVVITLRWQAGHVPTTGIRLIGGNYSHFLITHATASRGSDANGIPLPQVTLKLHRPREDLVPLPGSCIRSAMECASQHERVRRTRHRGRELLHRARPQSEGHRLRH